MLTTRSGRDLDVLWTVLQADVGVYMSALLISMDGDIDR